MEIARGIRDVPLGYDTDEVRDGRRTVLVRRECDEVLRPPTVLVGGRER